VREQHCSPHCQCRRRAEGAPGAEQRFPAAQESKSPHVDMGEPSGQQWVRPEGGTAHGEPCRSPSGRAAALESRLRWGRKAWGICCPCRAMGSSAGWVGPMVQSCGEQWLESCNLCEIHPGSVWEGQHSVGEIHMEPG